MVETLVIFLFIISGFIVAKLFPCGELHQREMENRRKLDELARKHGIRLPPDKY